MANLKSLFKDTVIYGLSSIVGRFLNYLLTPLYTHQLVASTGEYGIITEMYSYVAFILVVLTFGMETTFFRFINKEGENSPMRVYSTTLIAVGSVAALFTLAVWIGIEPISEFLHYTAHPEYITVMSLCVAIDAFLCIPFAYLRYQRKAIKFASLKLFIILLNVVLNLLYFYFLPKYVAGFEISVGNVFFINLACTLILIPLLYRELTGFRWSFDVSLMKRMWHYAWPLLILGIAGILNQTADKIIYRHVADSEVGKVELGIYGACVKVAMIMAVITQTFRYAYEPFVFSSEKEKNSKQTYAKAMKYYLIFTLLAFLIVIGYIDILKYIIAPDYWEGLRVVPIVMAAEIMMGVYFNLSFWYKLIDRTIWGAWFSGIGCAVLIIINIIGIPHFGYMACAWAGFAGYATSMLLSYFVGQRYNPINYPLKSMAVYVLITLLFFVVMQMLPAEWPVWIRLLINTLLILLFVAHIIHYDFPLQRMPVIGKYFRK